MPILNLIAPPLIGIIIVGALVLILQRLLRLPRTPPSADTGRELVPADDGEHAPTEAQRVDAAFGPWVTRVLPTLVGLLIVVVALWVFAYPGRWYLMGPLKLTPTLPASVVPPWFGSPGGFLACGLVGLAFTFAIAAAAVFGGAILLGLLWFIGRTALWPRTYR